MSKKFDEFIENTCKKLFSKNHNNYVAVQSYIPVEYINKNIIKLKNKNEYRTILKVSALNFFTKVYDEKLSIIQQFGVFLNNMNTSQISIQLLTQSKALDIKEQIDFLRELYEKCSNKNLKEYMGIYGNLLFSLAEDNEVIMKDFYIVVNYTAKEKDTFIDIQKNIAYSTSKVMQSIQGCGVDCFQLQNDEMYKVLYLFYNKDKSRFQNIEKTYFNNYTNIALSGNTNSDNPNNYSQQFTQSNQEDNNFFTKSKKEDIFATNNNPLDINYATKQSIENTKQDHNILDENIVTVEDILASDEIEIEKDHLVINNRYVRTIFLSGIDKNECNIEWLNNLFMYPANIDVSIHIVPIEKKVALDSLKKKLNFQVAALQESQNQGKTISEVDRLLAEELQYLREIISADEQMFSASLYITISEQTLARLNELTMQIETMLGNQQLLTRRAILTQLAAFDSVLPLGIDNIHYGRNITTEALSTFFPFVNSELSCMNGKPILYGRNLITGSLIFFDKFNPPDSSITNYNSIICGTTGSGKSFTTKLELTRRYINGTKIIGIDPNSEYLDVVSRCGGQHIKIDGSTKNKINILDISFYEEPDGTISNLLQAKISNLHSVFSMMFKINQADYTATSKNTIEKALYETYRRAGITDDPASLFVDNKLRSTKNTTLLSNYLKEPPILSDLAKVLISDFGDFGKNIVTNILYNFIEGSLNLFNGKTTIDMSSPMLFFDIKDTQEDVKPLVYLVLCEFVWEKIKRKPRHEKAQFIVDECWVMMKEEYTARFLAEFSRQVRKFNTGLSCVTQQANDFFKDKWGYGKTIYNNTAMHVLMRQTKEDVQIISETYKIPEYMKMELLSAKPGYGYIFWGNTFTKIYFEYSPEEFKIINTNPNLVQP